MTLFCSKAVKISPEKTLRNNASLSFPPEIKPLLLGDVFPLAIVFSFYIRVVILVYCFCLRLSAYRMLSSSEGIVLINLQRKYYKKVIALFEYASRRSCLLSLIGVCTRLQAPPPPFHINNQCFTVGVIPCLLIYAE